MSNPDVSRNVSFLNSNYDFLHSLINQHDKAFSTSPDKLAKAHAIVEQAKSSPPSSNFYNALQSTVLSTMDALGIKKPDRTDNLNLADPNQLGFKMYFDSPITLHFLGKAEMLQRAFNSPELQASHTSLLYKTAELISKYLGENEAIAGESFEHKQQGYQLQLPRILPNGKMDSFTGSTPQLIRYFHNNRVVTDGVSLTAGELVMSGDFFENADRPIADNVLPNEHIDRNLNINTAAPMVNVIHHNFQVTDASKNRFKDAYNNLKGFETNKTMWKLFVADNTRYYSNDSLDGLRKIHALNQIIPSYGDQLLNNIDHFSPWANQAFKSGQSLAWDMALKAHEANKAGNYKEANEFLQLSVQYTLYAQHFLTDGFCSGHARIGELRMRLREFTGGNILVNDMHNEDNEKGIYAKSNGEVIFIKGDNHLNDKDVTAAKQRIEMVMQLTINELSDIAKTGVLPSQSAADKFWPQVPENDKEIPNQRARMFKMVDNKVYVREPIYEQDPKKTAYIQLTPARAAWMTINNRVLDNNDGHIESAIKQIKDKVDSVWNKMINEAKSFHLPHCEKIIDRLKKSIAEEIHKMPPSDLKSKTNKFLPPEILEVVEKSFKNAIVDAKHIRIPGLQNLLNNISHKLIDELGKAINPTLSSAQENTPRQKEEDHQQPRSMRM